MTLGNTIHTAFRPTQAVTPGQPAPQKAANWLDPNGYQPSYPGQPGYPVQPSYPGYPVQPSYPGQPGWPVVPQPGFGNDGLVKAGKAIIPGAIAGAKVARVMRSIGRGGRSRVGYSRSYAPRNSYGNGYNSGYRSQGYRSSSRRTGGVMRSGGAMSRIMSSVKTSLIVGTLISVVFNGYQLSKNQITKGEAGANIAGDVVSSAVGGAAAAVASMAGTALFGGMLGTGFALTAGGMAFGVAGFMVADYFLRKTTLFQNFQNKIYTMLT